MDTNGVFTGDTQSLDYGSYISHIYPYNGTYIHSPTPPSARDTRSLEYGCYIPNKSLRFP